MAGSVAAVAYELDLSDAAMEEVVQDAICWANQHGLVVGMPPAMRGKSVPPEACVHVPLAALPVAFPKARFMQAKAIMPVFSRVVDEVAKDEAYLEATLAAAAVHDDFTARLLRLLRDTRGARAQRTELTLGILRSDYMLDAPSGGFLQVELNTIASSFGCLSSITAQMHKYLASRLPGLDASALPPNTAISGIPAALAAAAKAHGAPGGAVVMVVQPGERNAYDQQWLQLRLWEDHSVRTLRRSLAQIAAEGTLDPSSKVLSLQTAAGRAPVSVVYFRAGYTPDDYPSEACWSARELIEGSDAAKCPTVGYQLAGAKKVQQDLAAPGVLESFAERAGVADCSADMRTFFAGLWGMDDLSDPSTSAAVADALARPAAYVLKPQREGGGNNLYDGELVARLGRPEGLSAYILMQKILPPPQQSVLVRLGKWERADSVSELGIYGTFLRRGVSEVLMNEEVGHLVRTKSTSSNEGGVAAGFAVLDSPYLVD